jgi:hypothetical protein
MREPVPEPDAATRQEAEKVPAIRRPLAARQATTSN